MDQRGSSARCSRRKDDSTSQVCFVLERFGASPLPLFSLAHFTQSVSAPLTTFHGIPHRDRSKLGLGCTVRWSLSRNGCSGAGLGHCECKVADATGRFEKKKFVLDLALSLFPSTIATYLCRGRLEGVHGRPVGADRRLS